MAALDLQSKWHIAWGTEEGRVAAGLTVFMDGASPCLTAAAAMAAESIKERAESKGTASDL